MTGGFEDWAAARTPSLLAFATALVDDAHRADETVTRTLVRMRASWERVGRDDPDLEARRQVVRGCATPRRAAAVLRLLEERTDAEIAAILSCSESAARRHLQRGLEEADRGRVADTLSARDHVVARAGAAPTQLLTRAPESHAADVPPRRRRGTLLGAMAVVALVGGVALVSHESRTPDGVITYPHVDAPPSWRYESYAGVQLQVPDTWGWGSSPVESDHFPGKRHLGACGSNQASVLAPTDDSAYVSIFTDFVGRPAITNLRCVSWGASGSYPADDAVWFGSPLAVGVENVDGTVAETRELGDQHVTVFSRDHDLRRRILGTAEQVDVDGNGCPTRPVLRTTAGSPDLAPTSLSVCIYSQDTGVATLLWSGRLPDSEAAAYADAVADASGSGTGGCAAPSGRWVALGIHGDGDGDTRWDLADLGCGRLRTAGGRSAPLTAATVLPWAYGGVTAYLSAPPGRRQLGNYFQGPIG